ncbi:MAG: hypothetical protein R3C14_43235 [Caldilineaceae bacterium]
MTTNILPTHNGAVFNITLDPGYCFAMCLDMAKVLLTFQQQGRPKRLPVKSDLEPGKWAIVQSAYEINSSSNDETLIEAQSMGIVSLIGLTDFKGNFTQVVNTITNIQGTTVFGIMGPDSGHELLWHRDDGNNIWFYLDPNDGLWQFNNLDQGINYMVADLQQHYSSLNEEFDAFTLKLAD